MTRLFRVEFTHQYVIAVEDDEDADKVAQATFKDAIDNDCPADIQAEVIEEITTEADLPECYSEACIPYVVKPDSKPEKTIGQILDEQKEALDGV